MAPKLKPGCESFIRFRNCMGRNGDRRYLPKFSYEHSLSTPTKTDTTHTLRGQPGTSSKACLTNQHVGSFRCPALAEAIETRPRIQLQKLPSEHTYRKVMLNTYPCSHPEKGFDSALKKSKSLPSGSSRNVRNGDRTSSRNSATKTLEHTTRRDANTSRRFQL